MSSTISLSILDKEVVNKVMSLLLEAEAAVEENPNSATLGIGGSALRIINSFDIPKFRYDPVTKIFYEHTGRIPIHGDTSAKAAFYRDRFLFLFQRLSRDPHFSRPPFGSDISECGSCEISPIQSLVGRTGRRWIMGLISQLEDGHFYLEDLTSAVEVDLSNAKITTGFFSENTIVLAEGEMLLDGVFQIVLGDRSEQKAFKYTGITCFNPGSFL